MPVALPPSLLSRRRTCEACALVQHHAPREFWGATRSQDAETGTDLHDYADRLLKGEQVDMADVPDKARAAVEMYLDVVRNALGQFANILTWGSEYVLPQDPLYGEAYKGRSMRADVLIAGYYPSGEFIVHVIDLKSGVGTFVEPNDPELCIHGLTFLALRNLWSPSTGAAPDTTLKTTVVQPLFKDQTVDPVRTHIWLEHELQAQYNELRAYLEQDNRLESTPVEELPSTMFTPSSQCYADCASACPEVHRQIDDMVDLKIAINPKGDGGMSTMTKEKAERLRMWRAAINNLMEQATAITKKNAREGNSSFQLDYSHRTPIYDKPLEELSQKTGIPIAEFYAEPELLSPKAMLSRLRSQGRATEAQALEALLGEKVQERLVQSPNLTADATLAKMLKN